MGTDEKLVCWKNIFCSTLPPCGNPPVWRSTAPGCGMMLWCDQHAPHPDYRVRLETSPATSSPKGGKDGR